MYKKIIFSLILLFFNFKNVFASEECIFDPLPQNLRSSILNRLDLQSFRSFMQSSKKFHKIGKKVTIQHFKKLTTEPEKDVQNFISTMKEALSKVVPGEGTEIKNFSSFFDFFDTIEKQALENKNFDFLLKTTIDFLAPKIQTLHVYHFGCLLHQEKLYDSFCTNILKSDDIMDKAKAWFFRPLLHPEFNDHAYGMNYKAFPLIFDLFLKNGFDINICQPAYDKIFDYDYGRTPLGEMVVSGTNLSNIEFLLLKKANPNLKDKGKASLSPLSHAIYRYIREITESNQEKRKISLDIIDLLLKYGANPDEMIEGTFSQAKPKSQRDTVNDFKNEDELQEIFKKYEKK